ncbi:MAG: hypothetical protein ACRDKH_09935 [Solirubrobacterales bacterium]
MTTCPHTGITVPECSCRACVQALIEHHMPLSAAPGPTLIDAAPGRIPIEAAPRRLGRIRAVRRSRLRRTA